MAHYNESWDLPPLVGSCYMYGPQVGSREDAVKAAIDAYLDAYPDMWEHLVLTCVDAIRQRAT